MRPKQAVSLWPRRRKKRESGKERKEKKVCPLESGNGVLDVDIELCALSNFDSSEQWKRRNCNREISYCFKDENRDLCLLLSLEISFKWIWHQNVSKLFDRIMGRYITIFIILGIKN